MKTLNGEFGDQYRVGQMLPHIAVGLRRAAEAHLYPSKPPSGNLQPLTLAERIKNMDSDTRERVDLIVTAQWNRTAITAYEMKTSLDIGPEDPKVKALLEKAKRLRALHLRLTTYQTTQGIEDIRVRQNREGIFSR